MTAMLVRQNYWTIPKGTWARFDESEIKRRGTSEDHYKHPCLFLDPKVLADLR